MDHFLSDVHGEHETKGSDCNVGFYFRPSGAIKQAVYEKIWYASTRLT